MDVFPGRSYQPSPFSSSALACIQATFKEHPLEISRMAHVLEPDCGTLPVDL